MNVTTDELAWRIADIAVRWAGDDPVRLAAAGLKVLNALDEHDEGATPVNDIIPPGPTIPAHFHVPNEIDGLIERIREIVQKELRENAMTHLVSLHGYSRPAAEEFAAWAATARVPALHDLASPCTVCKTCTHDPDEARLLNLPDEIPARCSICGAEAELWNAQDEPLCVACVSRDSVIAALTSAAELIAGLPQQHDLHSGAYAFAAEMVRQRAASYRQSPR